MSAAEIKSIINNKLDHIPEDQLQKVFLSILDVIESASSEKIDLDKYAADIFEKNNELMKKLA